MTEKRWAHPVPTEIEVSCVIDGTPYTFRTWTDLSALLAIRLNARHPTPRRGCEAGMCGSCESQLNSQTVRLCLLRSPALQGAVVVTGTSIAPEN